MVNPNLESMYGASEEIRAAIELNNDLSMASRAYADGVETLYPVDCFRARLLARMHEEERGALTWHEVQQCMNRQ